MLSDYRPALTARLKREERRGTLCRRLCAIASLAGLSFSQRQTWYRIAASVPLSARHAQHVLDNPSGRTQM